MQGYLSAERLSEVSNTATQRLFPQPWKPSEEELTLGFQLVNALLVSDSLSTHNITLYAQRVIAQLCVLGKSERSRVGSVFALNGFWPQAKTLFGDRPDPVCNELMLTQVDALSQGEIDAEVAVGIVQDIIELSKKTTESNGNFSRYVDSIKSSLSAGESLILKNVVDRRTDNLKRKFDSFKSYSESNSRDGNIVWINAFFSTYVSAGVASRVQIFASERMQPILSNALPICEFTSKITDDSVYLVVSFKGAVVVYSANGRQGYLISVSKLPQGSRPIVEILGKFKSNLGFSMSKTGMWQYRVSFALKKLTGYVPKRSDYMIKK